MFTTVKHIDDYIINSLSARRAKKLYKNDIMNTILVGPSGSGKLTLARSIISYFQNDYNLSLIPRTYKIKTIDNSNKEITVISSKVHHEIGLNSYNFADKFSLISLLKTFTESKNILTDSYHIIIIKNGEFLSDMTCKAILKLTESYYENIRIIITCKNSSKISNYLTNFIIQRVPVEKKEIKEGYFKEMYGDDFKDEYMSDNLMKTTMLCELSRKGEKNYNNNEIEELFKNLFTLIKKKNINKYSNIRDILMEITCLNIEKWEIFKRFTKEFKNNYTVIKILAEADHKSVETYKLLIHLESLVVSIMNVI